MDATRIYFFKCTIYFNHHHRKLFPSIKCTQPHFIACLPFYTHFSSLFLLLSFSRIKEKEENYSLSLVDSCLVFWSVYMNARKKKYSHRSWWMRNHLKWWFFFLLLLRDENCLNNFLWAWRRRKNEEKNCHEWSSIIAFLLIVNEKEEKNVFGWIKEPFW